jgi:putative chitinase
LRSVGIIGQGIRIIIGLKKRNTANSVAAPGAPEEPFDTSRLLVSIFIGFIAGVLALIAKLIASANGTLVITTEFMMAVIAGGYAGVDFIEGMMQKHMPKPIDAQLRHVEPLLVKDESIV